MLFDVSAAAAGWGCGGEESSRRAGFAGVQPRRIRVCDAPGCGCGRRPRRWRSGASGKLAADSRKRSRRCWRSLWRGVVTPTPPPAADGVTRQQQEALPGAVQESQSCTPAAAAVRRLELVREARLMAPSSFPAGQQPGAGGRTAARRRRVFLSLTNAGVFYRKKIGSGAKVRAALLAWRRTRATRRTRCGCAGSDHRPSCRPTVAAG